MSKLDQFRKARVYLAGLYREKAVKLATLVAHDPAADHYGAFQACSIVWNSLVDIENAIRAEIIAGDVIDDFYRRQVATEGGSDA